MAMAKYKSLTDFLESKDIINFKYSEPYFNTYFSNDELLAVYAEVGKAKYIGSHVNHTQIIIRDIIDLKKKNGNKMLKMIKYPERKYDFYVSSEPEIDGCVNMGPGKYDEPIFKGTCNII